MAEVAEVADVSAALCGASCVERADCWEVLGVRPTVEKARKAVRKSRVRVEQALDKRAQA